MIQETVNVVIEGKGILTIAVTFGFDRSLRQHGNDPLGYKNITATSRLVAVNGNTQMERGGAWADKDAAWLSNYFDSHELFVIENYNDALYVAEMKARQNLVFIK